MTNENRIDKKFKELKALGKKAFISFITFGDPDIETSKKVVLEMEKKGADLIELGVPFSDPMAEGPVIQEANVRALKNDINLNKIFKAVSELREETQIPLVFLIYFNSLLSYGIEKFFENCKKYGIDGVIVPDLPLEESHEIYDYTVKNDVYQILLVTPTSTEDRIQKICEKAKGFIYCVSSMGVTGVRDSFDTDFNRMFEILKKYSDIPKCIGFGISTPKHIENLKTYCDGMIVGSALVDKIGQDTTNDCRIKDVGELTAQLADAAHS